MYDHVFILPHGKKFIRMIVLDMKALKIQLKFIMKFQIFIKKLKVDIIVLEKTSVKNRINEIHKIIDNYNNEI